MRDPAKYRSVLTALPLLLTLGCPLGSMILLVNEDIPYEASLADIPDEVLDKYRCGEALVMPSVVFDDASQQTYALRIDVEAPIEGLSVSIVSLRVLLGDEELEYGTSLVGATLSALTFSEEVGAFWAHTWGERFTRFTSEDLDDDFALRVLLDIEVSDKQGAVVARNITSTFVPRKVTRVLSV